MSADVHPQQDGTFLVDGGTSVRDLDRAIGSSLSGEGPLAPRTLNGLILEHLESIPEPGTSVLISGYPIEIMQTTEHAVKTARVDPRRRIPTPPPD
jgi:Mg2+/Co2+ transporter CorB